MCFVVLEIVSPYTSCPSKGQLGTSVGTANTFVWSVILFVYDRDAYRRLRSILLFRATSTARFVYACEVVGGGRWRYDEGDCDL